VKRLFVLLVILAFIFSFTSFEAKAQNARVVEIKNEIRRHQEAIKRLKDKLHQIIGERQAEEGYEEGYAEEDYGEEYYTGEGYGTEGETEGVVSEGAEGILSTGKRPIPPGIKRKLGAPPPGKGIPPGIKRKLGTPSGKGVPPGIKRKLGVPVPGKKLKQTSGRPALKTKPGQLPRKGPAVAPGKLKKPGAKSAVKPAGRGRVTPKAKRVGGRKPAGGRGKKSGGKRR
jgi:hypothetical protein